MSQLPLAALLIMPLLLASPPARAQMVPAPDLPASLLSETAGKLYNSPDTPSDAVPDPASAAAPTSADSDRPSSPPDPPLSAVSSSSSLASALPSALPATTSPEPPAPVTLPPKPARVHDLPAITGDHPRIRSFQAAAFSLTASTLGTGAELAIPVASTLNLRIGASYALLHYPFNIDGIDYTPGLKFTSGRATVDWFPHHGAFHISAGALYFRNAIGGAADVVEGGTFSLGGTNYINTVDDPIHGTATIAYGKQIAPLVLLGFGNILPRSGRHLSMPFEFGGAYLQPPTLNLKLSGTACTTEGCFNAATDPEVQSNLTKEVNTLQSDIRFLQIYPVVSLGLACRF